MCKWWQEKALCCFGQTGTLSVDLRSFENYLLLNILTMQHGFLLLWDWLLSTEHLVHYYHLSHEL